MIFLSGEVHGAIYGSIVANTCWNLTIKDGEVNQVTQIPLGVQVAK